jgi:hypothetical protein
MPICCYTCSSYYFSCEVVFDMSSSQDDPGGELQALPPQLIETINGTTPGVLRNKHVSLLKQLAKLARNIDLRISIRNGKVCRISHEIDDFHLVIEE